MSVFTQMFRHMFWADQRAIAVLQGMNDPPPQAIDLMAHLLAAEHVWLRRVQQVSPTYPVWPKLGLEECGRLAAANHEAFQRIIDAADETALATVVSYRNTRGDPFDSSLADILLHVSHHGMYHRGQIALLVRASRGTPLPTDYIVYTRGG